MSLGFCLLGFSLALKFITSKIELVSHPTHTSQHKPSSLPPSFSLGKWNHHTPWKHESLPALIQLSHLHVLYLLMAPGPPHRGGGQLSSLAHPASPPNFHKERFANLTCPRIELNHLIWDKRISQSHPLLQHSSLFKSLGPGALSLTSCVTSGKILNLSVLPMQSGDSNSTFLIRFGNIICANIHKSFRTVPGTQ